MSCTFCDLIKERNRAIFSEDHLFVAMWSSLPASAGHALVMPKRHVQRFRDMNEAQMRQIIFAVAAAETKIEQADLKAVCVGLEVISESSQHLITQAQQQLKKYDYQPPRAFNDGINDGPEAGQSVPHLHWHILPRWSTAEGDIIQRFISQADTL